MPFGGYKESGYGRENGLQVMDHYTQTKSVWVDLQEQPADWFADGAGRERHEQPRARADARHADPGFFEEVARFTGHPWRNGVLEPKVKEFVLHRGRRGRDAPQQRRRRRARRACAGLRRHPARGHGGARADQRRWGIHACNCGVPILLEELAEAAGSRSTSLSH